MDQHVLSPALFFRGALSEEQVLQALSRAFGVARTRLRSMESVFAEPSGPGIPERVLYQVEARREGFATYLTLYFDPSAFDLPRHPIELAARLARELGEDTTTDPTTADYPPGTRVHPYLMVLVRPSGERFLCFEDLSSEAAGAGHAMVLQEAPEQLWLLDSKRPMPEQVAALFAARAASN